MNNYGGQRGYQGGMPNASMNMPVAMQSQQHTTKQGKDKWLTLIGIGKVKTLHYFIAYACLTLLLGSFQPGF